MLKQQVGEPFPVIWVRIFALEGAVFALICLFTVIGGHSLERARQGLDGGLVGWGLVEAVSSVIGLFGAGALAVLVALIGGLIGLGLTGRVRGQLQTLQANSLAGEYSQPELELSMEDELQGRDSSAPAKRKRTVPPEFRKQFKVDQNTGEILPAPPRAKGLPGLDLLQPGKAFKPDQRHINTSAGLIEKTLAEFGIPAQVIGFQVGPTVTQFAVKPGYLNGPDDDTDEERKQVRVSRITSLKKTWPWPCLPINCGSKLRYPGDPMWALKFPMKNHFW